jgi:radical SAM superfamily enzyme YgiQ (UPF0313 family)
MAKVILVDPLGFQKGRLRHCHFLRDWSGSYILGYIPFPPLDLIYAAAYIRACGHDTHIIEASVKHWPHKKVADIIKEKSPDFVLIPSTYFSLDDDKYLASLIRCSLPDGKIIFAGPLVTYDPSLALSDRSADFVILGDLEVPLLNIIRSDYNENIAYKENGKIICGKRKLYDLNELPIPARDLIDNQAYNFAVFNKKNPVTTMTISRGCPHSKCKFCHSPLYTLGEIRYRSADSILEEINEIVFKYKFKEIFFRDQTFTANRELVSKICEYIIKNNIPILWRASTRVDLVDKELLTLMHKAGCYQLSFGFESCSQRTLDMNVKGITIEQSRNAAKWAKEAGIEILGLFQFGMLGDTEDSMRQLFKFVLELDVDYANFNAYFLIPGNPIYDEYLHDKSILLPQELTKKYAISAYIKFYFRPKYLLKQLTKIKSLKELMFLFRTGLDAFLSYF